MGTGNQFQMFHRPSQVCTLLWGETKSRFRESNWNWFYFVTIQYSHVLGCGPCLMHKLILARISHTEYIHTQCCVCAPLGLCSTAPHTPSCNVQTAGQVKGSVGTAAILLPTALVDREDRGRTWIQLQSHRFSGITFTIERVMPILLLALTCCPVCRLLLFISFYRFSLLQFVICIFIFSFLENFLQALRGQLLSEYPLGDTVGNATLRDKRERKYHLCMQTDKEGEKKHNKIAQTHLDIMSNPPVPPSSNDLMEHWTAAPPVAPWGGGTNRRVCSTNTSSSWRTQTTHCSSSSDTASHSDCNCHTNATEQNNDDNVLLSVEKRILLYCQGRYSTLLSARLVMQALAARWATKAASKAAAALWDWIHVCRTCCHQGEIDCGSHESSTAPEEKK